MRPKLCQLHNVRMLGREFDKVAERRTGEPGILIVYGHPGAGKTYSSLWLANRCAGVIVEANPIWSPTWMLSDICRALGGEQSTKSQPMFDFIVRELRRHPRPLIFDEADRLARRETLVEMLRMIHDQTASPFILIGMSEFKRAAIHRPQLSRRIVGEVAFGPLGLDDARQLATELCEVPIADEAIRELCKTTGGSVGLLVRGLADLERLARKSGGVKVAEVAAA